MQANCPKCANNIVIDDARVPERAFSVKCPKCQTSVRFPGKGAAAGAPAPVAAPTPAPSRAAAPPPPRPAPPEATRPDTGAEGAAEALRAEVTAQVRQQMALGQTAPGSAGRALISVADRALGAALAATLGRVGYQAENLDNPDEGARLIDQGVYDVVVTTRADAAGGRESLYQRLARLSPDTRRRVFVVLVGDDLKTGDGTQAWIALADLVAHPKDLATLDGPLTKTIQERQRLYQAYVDARKRFEASAVSSL